MNMNYLNYRGFKLTLLFFVLFAFVSITSSQTTKVYSDEEVKKSDSLFNMGNDLMEQRKYLEALIKYKEGLAVTPDSTGLLYNGGLAAFETKDYELAIKLWTQLKRLEPSDMQVRSKLVQTFQAGEKFEERDRERKELFELRRSGKGEGLANNDFYVREQVEIAGKKVMIFEHFELKGDRAVKYVFYVLNNDGKTEYKISMGSYALTNGLWRATAKPTPAENERLFHLDGYYSWGHATFGMYPKEPTYDEIRKIVKEIIEKGQKPISSTVITKPVEKPKVIPKLN